VAGMINTVHTGFYSIRALRALDLILAVAKPTWVHTNLIHVYFNKKIVVTSTGELCLKLFTEDALNYPYYTYIFKMFLEKSNCSIKSLRDQVVADSINMSRYILDESKDVDPNLVGEPLSDPFKIGIIEYHFNECRKIFIDPKFGLTESEILMKPHLDKIRELLDKK